MVKRVRRLDTLTDQPGVALARGQTSSVRYTEKSR
jgi:hypothetical protein